MWLWVGFMVACGLVLVFVGNGNQKLKNRFSSAELIFPENIKPLLIENFPEHKDIFTTSFCSTFWPEIKSFAHSKTGINDDVKAFAKLHSMVAKNKELDDEFINTLISKMPDKFRSTLQSGDERDKFEQAIAFATTQSISSNQ